MLVRRRTWYFLALASAGLFGCDSGSQSPGGSGGGSSAGASTGGNAPGGSAAGGSAAGSAGTGPAGGAGGGAVGGGGGTTGGAGASGGGMSGASGGSGGAAGSAGASGGGATCSAIPGALFCEDFETVAAGALTKTNKYAPVTTGGTLTVDGAQARGKQALHVHTQGNGHAYLQVSPFAPPQNSFFGRAWVYVKAFPTAPNYAHFTLVEAAGATPSDGLIRPIGGQFIDGMGSLWGAGSDQGPTGDWTNWNASAPATGGKWVCIEWQMKDATSAIDIWHDGVAKTELSVDAKNHGGSAVDFKFPSFDKVWFGWWLYQAGPTPNEFDVWFDDLALAPQRIPCGT